MLSIYYIKRRIVSIITIVRESVVIVQYKEESIIRVHRRSCGTSAFRAGSSIRQRP